MSKSTPRKPVYAFATGNNHLPYLAPIIQSITRVCSGEKPHFCILLPERQASLPVYSDCTFKIISDEDLRLCESIYFQEGRADIPPFAAYSQLMLPRYFSEHKKILFLEVDQIVQHDLKPLWEDIYFKDIKLGAVRTMDGETGEYIESPDQFYKAAFPNAKSYNTGVFLFDTEYWVSNQLEASCLHYVSKQQETKGQTYMFYAQGAINCALSSRITDLDSVYNWTGLGYRPNISSSFLKKAAIPHWNGPLKPWMDGSMYQDVYYGASGMTSAQISFLRQHEMTMLGKEVIPNNSKKRKTFKYYLKRILGKLKND
jgi:lipopolysaccharide biosynthesis glycosyltransferase